MSFRHPGATHASIWFSHSREEPGITFDAPCGPDRRLLYHWLCCLKDSNGLTLEDELKRRGYLLETLRFSCKRNRASNEPDPRDP